ncbi:unnamed protein product [Calicophoron daubneyi]|uniref:Glycosyltransferase-like protein LARGE2 n=1 Tax=Calicophoron daubneyi TaxID=300641 RepID=A0AAV2TN04_CALDB
MRHQRTRSANSFTSFLVHHAWKHMLLRDKPHCLLRWILIWMVYTFYMQTVPTVIESSPGTSRQLTTNVETKNNQTIHLAFLVTRQKDVSQLIILIKTIVYHQGRVDPQASDCALHIDTIQNEACQPKALSAPNSLELHLLADNRSKETVQNYFENWSLNGLKINYYDLHTYRHIIDFIPKEAMYEATSVLKSIFPKFAYNILKDYMHSLIPVTFDDTRVKFLKVAWPEILPDEVKQVIAMDTDMLLNQDIRNLWREFESFSPEQMIGGVFQQTNNLLRYTRSKYHKIIGTGINSGLLLLHVDRMRSFDWSQKWRNTIKEFISLEKPWAFRDQVVYNAILYSNQQILHEIPCEWNVVVSKELVVRQCPAAWVVRHPDRTDCLTAGRSSKLRLLGAAHHGASPKPKPNLMKNFRNHRPKRTLSIFRMMELHETYYEVFFAFLHLPVRCLK